MDGTRKIKRITTDIAWLFRSDHATLKDAAIIKK